MCQLMDTSLGRKLLILQKKLNITYFKASEGWLDQWKNRHVVFQIGKVVHRGNDSKVEADPFAHDPLKV